jgi:3-isopropylmalate dehydrogenase
MSKKILTIAGDGIGPEIMEGAVLALKRVAELADEKIEISEALAGGAAIDRYGVPLPNETIQKAREADAILLGAVGDPKHDQIDPSLRPEKAILGLRKELGLYANLRPVNQAVMDVEASPLKAERLAGVDLIVVRELVGGIYFGERQEGDVDAWDVESYHSDQIERITHQAAAIAMTRKKKVTSVDKANVLATSRLWRRVVDKVALQYPEVTFEHMYVDNCAMQLISRPSSFDVILTNNLFGDILSDEAAVLTGSLGVMPSASLGESGGLYEPIHGSAPDIAGQDKANPIGMILSAALCCELTLEKPEWGRKIREAVQFVWDDGWRTADLARASEKCIGTKEMIRRIVDKIK